MLCSAVSLALTWLLALCLAFPQLPSNNDESIHEKWASSTHNKKLQPDGDDGASYPETIVYRRSEASVEGPPADKMEIAGFQMFLGDKPEGMQVFAIVNEYKGQQLIRQNACLKSLVQETTSPSPGGCYDMSDYQPVVGDRGVLSQEQYTTVFNNLMAIRHDSLRTTIAINAAYNKNQHLWIQFGHQSKSPKDWKLPKIFIMGPWDCVDDPLQGRKTCTWLRPEDVSNSVRPYYWYKAEPVLYWTFRNSFGQEPKP